MCGIIARTRAVASNRRSAFARARARAMLRALASAMVRVLQNLMRLCVSFGRAVCAARRARVTNARVGNQTGVGRRRRVDDDDDARWGDAGDPLGGATARRAPNGLASVRSSRAVRVRFVNW